MQAEDCCTTRSKAARSEPNFAKLPNNQLQAVFLRLSPSCGLTQARNHSSHAPRTQHTPSSALPTPAPRARRTYNFCCSRAARTSRTQATPGLTHMRHKPTRTTRAATRPLSLRTNVRVGTEPRRRQSPFAPFYTRKARSAILQQQIRGTGCSCSCTRVRGGSLQKTTFAKENSLSPAHAPVLHATLRVAHLTRGVEPPPVYSNTLVSSLARRRPPRKLIRPALPAFECRSVCVCVTFVTCEVRVCGLRCRSGSSLYIYRVYIYRVYLYL